MREDVKALVGQIHQDLSDDLRVHLTDAQILVVLPCIKRYADGLLDAAELLAKSVKR